MPILPSGRENGSQGDVLNRQLSYWKRQLAGAPLSVDLPTDLPSPPVRTHQAGEVHFNCSEKVTRKLHALNLGEGATLYMTLLAAFQVLLHRLTAQEDIVIGTALAGRNQAETEGLIGFFVNTLPVRVNFAGNPTFRELLARVRDYVLGMLAHQDLPFEKLVKELNPERNTNRNPLFQVMFTMDDGLDAKTELPGLHTRQFPLDCVAAKFDLTLTFAEIDGKLDGWFAYDCDLFATATIERMAGNLQRLIEGIAAAPDSPISTLPLLTDAENHHLLVEWNATRMDYPAGKCVHQLFDARAVQAPNAVAVIFEDQQLTYGQLNARANQLARHLQKAGVGPDSLVGICVERSLEMVVGLLGIVKAGGAYVPLDPEHPRERLALYWRMRLSPCY